MSKNTDNIIEYMKEHYSHTYMRFSNDGKLDHKSTFEAIKESIKVSKSHHCGLDMSGLVNLLSTIKLERLALGLLDKKDIELYPDQWERLDDMIIDGITRYDPYANFGKSKPANNIVDSLKEIRDETLVLTTDDESTDIDTESLEYNFGEYP